MLIAERTEAKKQKDFIRADEIRSRLKEQGIVLTDSPSGTVWKRI
jgi:cysteinyl-tRNA synthetase